MDVQYAIYTNTQYSRDLTLCFDWKVAGTSSSGDQESISSAMIKGSPDQARTRHLNSETAIQQQRLNQLGHFRITPHRDSAGLI